MEAVYEKACFAYLTVKEWRRKIESGREENKEQLGALSTASTDRNRQISRKCWCEYRISP